MNYGLTSASTQQEWEKLGPLSKITPADVMNKGAMARRSGSDQSGQRLGQSTEGPTQGTDQNSQTEVNASRPDEELQEMREAMALAIELQEEEQRE